MNSLIYSYDKHVESLFLCSMCWAHGGEDEQESLGVTFQCGAAGYKVMQLLEVRSS